MCVCLSAQTNFFTCQDSLENHFLPAAFLIQHTYTLYRLITWTEDVIIEHAILHAQYYSPPKNEHNWVNFRVLKFLQLVIIITAFAGREIMVLI